MMADINPIIENKSCGYRVVATATGTTYGEKLRSLRSAVYNLSRKDLAKSALIIGDVQMITRVASLQTLYYTYTYTFGTLLITRSFEFVNCKCWEAQGVTVTEITNTTAGNMQLIVFD